MRGELPDFDVYMDRHYPGWDNLNVPSYHFGISDLEKIWVFQGSKMFKQLLQGKLPKKKKEGK